MDIHQVRKDSTSREIVDKRIMFRAALVSQQLLLRLKRPLLVMIKYTTVSRLSCQ